MNKQDQLMYMKSLGIKFDRHLPYEERDGVKNIGMCNGFFIYCKSYYYIVSGKIPFEMANYIFKNYDNKKFQIRVQGNSEKSKPDEWKTSDEYKEYVQNYLDSHDIMDDFEGYAKIMKDKKAELLENNSEEFYIEYYHIDTNEGLKVVIDYIKENNIRTIW